MTTYTSSSETLGYGLPGYLAMGRDIALIIFVIAWIIDHI